jgi:hypothetical protein
MKQALLAFVIGFILVQLAQGQHFHPQEHAQLHDTFYQNLIRPDIPGARPGSCCGNMDCYPTRAEFKQGQWWALRREDKQWIPVPNERVIKNEVSPDGRAHLCATLYFTYCFIPEPSGV